MQRLPVVFFPILVLSSSFAYAQKNLPPDDSTRATVTTHFPKAAAFQDAKVNELNIDDNFKVEVAAKGLGKPRMLATDKQGRLYITRRDQGDVLLLQDKDNDGKFDDLQTVVSKFKGVHGIDIHNGYLYLISNRELKRAKLNEDGTVDKPEMLADDLPDGGQHGNRTLAFGPDGKLYLTIGSTCNDCNETNKESATILVADEYGKNRKIFARGLRNTIGIDFHPTTHELWGADNGTDWRGDNIPPEEINLIQEGKNYGWPFIFGKQQPDKTREDPIGTTKEEFAKTTEPSLLDLPAHSAPINFKFLGKIPGLPDEYKDDAIVTLHGSWNRQNPDGYKVVRIVFENNKPGRYEDFLSGFLSEDGQSRFGRPAGIAISDSGTIYVSDDGSGVIYRVTYQGKGVAKK